MHKNLHIRIDNITRVEGHGNIVIDMKRGRVAEVRLEIIESPRFFEEMLRGRKYDDAHHLMSRICGICAVSHTSASLKAIESALGIRVSEQSLLLRKLAFCGETIQSHILHLFFLVLPDIMKVGSIAPLMETDPGVVRIGLDLKRLANELCAVVGGRHIHPISLVPGGVAHAPKAAELKSLKKALAASFDGLDRALAFFVKKPFPYFTRPREFISLKARGEYAIYDGAPYSSKRRSFATEDYAKKVSEYVVKYSTAKQARTSSGSFMVGALSRVNNNFRLLKPRAKGAARKAGLKSPPFVNPFLNNIAQLIECFHLTEEAVSVIDRLLVLGPKPEPLKKPRSHGRGVGIVEAPRGTLYHDYVIDGDGFVTKADCVIPTAQNLRMIEEDLRAFVPTIIDKGKDEITRSVETLVRAYDPCISCSTHIMEVEFT